MAWATAVGDQVARGVNYGVSNFNAPNYLYWWILPFVITMLIVGALAFWGLSKVDTLQKCGEDVKEVDEEGNKKECEEVEFPLWLKIVIGCVISVVIAGAVAAGVYKMAVYAKNPKMAAGIETVGYVRNAWSD